MKTGTVVILMLISAVVGGLVVQSGNVMKVAPGFELVPKTELAQLRKAAEVSRSAPPLEPQGQYFIGCNDTGPNAHPLDPNITRQTSEPRYDGLWDWMFLINPEDGWASWLTREGDPGEHKSPPRVEVQRAEPSIIFGFTAVGGFQLNVSLNMLSGKAKITTRLGRGTETYEAACRLLFSNPLKKKNR